MVLSKRERYVAIGAVAVIALVVLNYFFVSPLLATRIEVDEKIELKQRDLDDAQRLVDDSHRKGRTWTEMTAAFKRDASEAESQVLHNVLDWAQDAGLMLSSVKPERTEKEKDFYKITFRATGTGSMAQLGSFLWRIQTSNIPVRVSDLSISSRKEGTDDLSIQLGISTIYLTSDAAKIAKPVATSASREATP